MGNLDKYFVNGHSLLGASTVDLAAHCQLGILLKKAHPEDNTSTLYSTEGDVAHALAAECLTTGNAPERYIDDPLSGKGDLNLVLPDHVAENAVKFDVRVDTLMCEHIQYYLDEVKAVHKELGGRDVGGKLYVESGVGLPHIHVAAKGTVDAAIALPLSTLHVFDLKYGANVAVNAEGNTQTRTYALSFIGEGNPQLFTDVVMHIVQPRIKYGSRHSKEVMPIEELLKWGEEFLTPALRGAGALLDRYHEDPIATMAAAEYAEGKGCRWCRRKVECPLAVERFESASQAFGELPIPKPEALPNLPDLVGNEALLYTTGKKLIAWIEKCIGDTKDKVLGGEPVDGLKPVVYQVRDVWVDESKVARLLKRVDDAFKPRTLKTPKQVMGVLGNDPTLPVSKGAVEELIAKRPLYTVAPASDKREAVIFEDADAAFNQ